MLFNLRVTSYLFPSVCNHEDASNKRFIQDCCCKSRYGYGAEAVQEAIQYSALLNNHILTVTCQPVSLANSAVLNYVHHN